MSYYLLFFYIDRQISQILSIDKDINDDHYSLQVVSFSYLLFAAPKEINMIYNTTIHFV